MKDQATHVLTQKIRVDEVIVGDVIVTDDRKYEVTYVFNGMMGINWHSIWVKPVDSTERYGSFLGHEDSIVTIVKK